MYSIELRNQMVIHKAKKTSLTVSTKSILSFVAVWGLWEILKAALAFVLIQLVILQAWCLYVHRVMRYRRKYRSGRGN